MFQSLYLCLDEQIELDIKQYRRIIQENLMCSGVGSKLKVDGGGG